MSWARLLFATFALATPSLAWAHAALRHAAPAAGAVLNMAPDELQLEFSEAVDQSSVVLTLKASSGAKVTLTAPEAQPAKGAVVRRLIDETLKPDHYDVVWRLVSGDGHVSRGDYTFEVTAEK